jgi:hypothetical protein
MRAGPAASGTAPEANFDGSAVRLRTNPSSEDTVSGWPLLAAELP